MMIPPELKHIAVEKGAENTSFMDKLCSNQLFIVFQTSSYWVGHSIYGVFTYIHPLNYPNDGIYIYIYTLGIIFWKKMMVFLFVSFGGIQILRGTLPEANITMENPPFWWYLPGKMGIFMGYVC